MTDTIFAVSSGTPPCAIAVIRISGPEAGDAVRKLAGSLPDPRRASLRTLRDADGALLDSALILWFPGPRTATGEDLAELHCHGGRAVIAEVQRELAGFANLRHAEAGEFTRRAFANGVLDLAEAEGLGDLLAAETELQRQAATRAFCGAISRQAETWRARVLALGAQIEAVLDFSDEDDVEDLPEAFFAETGQLAGEMAEWLERPPVELLREGVRVVLAGPPNSGKSSLFNALVRDAAAIVSPVAGTTRDAIERPVALGGVPLVLVDTAGLRDDSDDAIERIGIERAGAQLDRADIVLWLGPEGEGPVSAVEVAARADADDFEAKRSASHTVSVVTGFGIDALEREIVERARSILPKPGEAALNARQRRLVGEAVQALQSTRPARDLLTTGEELRIARRSFDALLGRASTEDMLDALFGRFCIGK